VLKRSFRKTTTYSIFTYLLSNNSILTSPNFCHDKAPLPPNLTSLSPTLVTHMS